MLRLALFSPHVAQMVQLDHFRYAQNVSLISNHLSQVPLSQGLPFQEHYVPQLVYRK